jgi:hypothetical protein
MRKKSGLTIVEQAVTLVHEFDKVVRKLEQQVTLRGQSGVTLYRRIPHCSHSSTLLTQNSIYPERTSPFFYSVAIWTAMPCGRGKLKESLCFVLKVCIAGHRKHKNPHHVNELFRGIFLQRSRKLSLST